MFLFLLFLRSFWFVIHLGGTVDLVSHLLHWSNGKKGSSHDQLKVSMVREKSNLSL